MDSNSPPFNFNNNDKLKISSNIGQVEIIDDKINLVE